MLDPTGMPLAQKPVQRATQLTIGRNGHVALSFTSPADAQARGLAMTYQEPTLFSDLDVAENISLGLQPLRAGPFVDRPVLYSRAEEALAALGAGVRTRSRVAGVPVADQQLV